MKLGNFEVKVSACGNYLYANHKDGYIQIKLDDEGIVVDIFDNNHESQATPMMSLNHDPS
jgi:translation initiation factor 6 (eIF-6)